LSDDLAWLDATAQAERVRRGEASPRELVEAAIARLEKLDPELGILVTPTFERARERAAALSAGEGAGAQGPFCGVPFLMKDIGGEEAGVPCHMGMRALRDAGHPEARDSVFTERVRRAGLVSLGRSNTPELALLPVTEPDAFRPTRSPWSLEHSPGGSSGGASAAVAAGVVPMAHASDGGGSIRIPAAHAGLVGLKPTRGRCSFGPKRGERWSGFSCELVVTRSVRDTAAFLDVVSGPAPGDPYSAAPPARPFAREVAADPGALRIAVLARPPRDGLPIAPECEALAERTGRLLESLGHRVEHAHPTALEDPAALASYVGVVACNIARAVAATGERLGRALGPDDVEPLTWALAERGRAVSAPDFLATLENVHRFGREVAAWWEEGFDLLLTPTTAQPPPRIGAVSSTPEEPLRAFLAAAPYGAFTSPFNQTGQPAISLPLGQSEAGLPLGIQLVAATGREDLLLRMAAQLEAAEPWAERRPPLHA